MGILGLLALAPERRAQQNCGRDGGGERASSPSENRDESFVSANVASALPETLPVTEDIQTKTSGNRRNTANSLFLMGKQIRFARSSGSKVR
jgi:hypothetical protein